MVDEELEAREYKWERSWQNESCKGMAGGAVFVVVVDFTAHVCRKDEAFRAERHSAHRSSEAESDAAVLGITHR